MTRVKRNLRKMKLNALLAMLVLLLLLLLLQLLLLLFLFRLLLLLLKPLLLLLLLLLILLLLLLLLLLFCPAHYSQSISKRADAIMIGMKSQQGKPKRTLPKEKTIKNKTELIRVAFER